MLLEKELRTSSMNTLVKNSNIVIGKRGNGNQLSDVVIPEHPQKPPHLNMLQQNI